MNKQHGLTMRTTCRVLDQVAGLRLNPGGLARVVQRVGHMAEAPYEALIVDVSAAAAVDPPVGPLDGADRRVGLLLVGRCRRAPPGRARTRP